MKSTNTKTPRGKFILSSCQNATASTCSKTKQNKNTSKNSLFAGPGNSSGDIKISLKTQIYHKGSSFHEVISTNRTNIQAKFCFPMYPPIEVKVENITDEAQPLNHGFFAGWRNQKSETTPSQNTRSLQLETDAEVQSETDCCFNHLPNKQKQNNNRGGWGVGGGGGGGKKERIHTHSQKEPLAKCRLGLKKQSNINYPTCIPLFVNLSIHQHVCTCGAENTHHIL